VISKILAENYSIASYNSNYDPSLRNHETQQESINIDFLTVSSSLPYNQPISEAEVLDAIRRYSKNSASGFDSIIIAMMNHLHPSSIAYLIQPSFYLEIGNNRSDIKAPKRPHLTRYGLFPSSTLLVKSSREFLIQGSLGSWSSAVFLVPGVQYYFKSFAIWVPQSEIHPNGSEGTRHRS